MKIETKYIFNVKFKKKNIYFIYSLKLPWISIFSSNSNISVKFPYSSRWFSNVNDMKNKINSDILSRAHFIESQQWIIERVFDYFSSCRDKPWIHLSEAL